MSLSIIILLGVLFILTVILTLYAFLREERKMREYEERGETVADELRRSREYETESIKYHLPGQVIFYLISCIVLMIGLFIFMYILMQ